MSHARFSQLTADQLEVLRERARALAKAPLAADEEGERLEILEIESRGQTFAVPLATVEGIVDLESLALVPRAPPFVRGLVSFHGEVLLAIELSGLTGNPSSGFADLKRVIALKAGANKLAIVAEKVVSVRPSPAGAFRSDPLRQQPFVVGTDTQFVCLLEPRALVAHVFSQLTSGEG